MGLFKSIKKAVKGIFKGIKKAFKSVFKAVGKIASSKWGKILLTAAAIFSGGMALAGMQAGWSQAASQGLGFMDKFVAGAKGFVTALFNPIDQAKSMMGTAPSTIGQAQKLTSNLGPTGEAVQNIQKSAGMPTSVPPGASANVSGVIKAPSMGVQNAPGLVETTTKAADSSNWLSKAAGFAKDFLTSPAGASMIEGYAMGGAAEEQQKFDDRVRLQWMDPNNALAKSNAAGGNAFSVNRGGAPIFNPGGGTLSNSAPQNNQPVQTSGAMPGEPLPVGV